MLKKLLKAAVMGWLAKRLAGGAGWKRKTWDRRGDTWDGYGRPHRYGHPSHRPRLKDMLIGMVLRRFGR